VDEEFGTRLIDCHETYSMAHQLPPLRKVPLSDVLDKAPPVLKIKTEEDVEFWKTTRGYSDLGLYLQRLNEAVVGYHLPFTPQSPSQVSHFLFVTCLLIIESSVWLQFLQFSTS
jgi:hypothetical protein